MSNPLYVNLTRQSALLKEIDVIATNISNMNTNGYRKEALVFSEFIKDMEGPTGSLSMTATRARYVSDSQGAMSNTGSQFDFAIEGEGYFMVMAPGGERLTRAGSFTLNPVGELVTVDGYQVLGAGGGSIVVPPGGRISVSAEGAISVDDQPIGELAIMRPAEGSAVRREAGVLLIPQGPIEPAPDAKVAQGFVEGSNVKAIEEITRMIEVQRSYELGQSLTDLENQRLDTTIQTLGRPL